MHLSLKSTTFDPYELIKKKTSRLSWNKLSDAESHLDKYAIINWFSLLRDYSDSTVRAILTEGILESQFNNITFILRLAQEDDFRVLATKNIYKLLYDFVCETPQGVRDCIDEKDYLMSRDVLALLSKSR